MIRLVFNCVVSNTLDGPIRHNYFCQHETRDECTAHRKRLAVDNSSHLLYCRPELLGLPEPDKSPEPIVNLGVWEGHRNTCYSANCPVAVRFRNGRWYIEMDHPGFNSRVNNGRGYAAELNARAAIWRYANNFRL